VTVRSAGGTPTFFIARHLGWGALGEFKLLSYSERLRDRHLSPFQRPKTGGEGLVKGRVPDVEKENPAVEGGSTARLPRVVYLQMVLS
jgi:hypothetical protein